YAVRADRSNYIAMTRKMRYLLHLAELPQYTEGEVFHVAGPLTQYVLDNIPKGTESIVVRDFSKVFMDEAEFLHAERDFRIMVAGKLMFGGFAVSLKGILQDEFIRALGNDAGRYLISMDVCAGMQ
ncbi:MAG: hypothetical protein LLF89_11160, partial [Spirochaetaceae bacterium]|nr:hypothetical protein [Spirochaetaceae bacterium]